MRVVIAGGHGQVAMHLERLLDERGDDVVGLIRSADQGGDLRLVGAVPVICDLEHTDVATVARHLAGCDATVFAAGAGPGSGAARKETVDRDAAVLLAEAASMSGVHRYLLVSSIGADDPPPPGSDEVFAAYLRAKHEAEVELRRRALELTILRPGQLTDGAPTGLVALSTEVVRGAIPRADVAAVMVALLDEPRTAGLTLELASGPMPVGGAVSALVA
ncbi:MAG: SDR family oxidoreductase [Acidimicrobiales bacterium]